MGFFYMVLLCLLGFAVGYFLALPALIVLTVASLVLAVITRPKDGEDLGGVIGMLVWVALALANGAMWVTHFLVAGGDVVPSLVHFTRTYILR